MAKTHVSETALPLVILCFINSYTHSHIRIYVYVYIGGIREWNPEESGIPKLPPTILKQIRNTKFLNQISALVVPTTWKTTTCTKILIQNTITHNLKKNKQHGIRFYKLNTYQLNEIREKIGQENGTFNDPPRRPESSVFLFFFYQHQSPLFRDGLKKKRTGNRRGGEPRTMLDWESKWLILFDVLYVYMCVCDRVQIILWGWENIFGGRWKGERRWPLPHHQTPPPTTAGYAVLLFAIPFFICFNFQSCDRGEFGGIKNCFFNADRLRAILLPTWQPTTDKEKPLTVG